MSSHDLVVSGAHFSSSPKRRSKGSLPDALTPFPPTLLAYVSGISDTEEERSALISRVQRSVESWARTVGCEFQLIDMHWDGDRMLVDGLPNAAQLCEQELARCDSSSVFVSFLAQKVGSVALPTQLPLAVFRLTKALSEEDSSLLLAWYKKDDNANPPCYVLEPPAGTAAIGTEERRAAVAKLQKAFKAAVEKDPELANLIPQQSLIEIEHKKGPLADPPLCQTVWIDRQVGSLDKHKGDAELDQFLDTINGEANPRAEARYKALRSSLEAAGVTPTTFETTWNKPAIPESKLSQELIRQLKQHFNPTVKAFQGNGLTDLEKVLLTQAEIARDLLSRPSVDDSAANTIAKHVNGPSRPLVIFGRPGVGKMTAMARFAVQTKEKSPNTVLVSRYLQTQTSACTLEQLLFSICEQISIGYETSFDHTGRSSVATLSRTFKSLLKLATSQRPLCVVVGGLDRAWRSRVLLSAADVSWIPNELPEHVTIVVSVASEQVSALQLWCPDPVMNYVEIKVLPASTRVKLVEQLLSNGQRNLTKAQRQTMKDILNAGETPLQAKMVAHEALQWRSWQVEAPKLTAGTVVPVFEDILALREATIGAQFVSNALGLLTAARRGLSEVEIIHVQSLCEEALDAVNTGEGKSGVRRMSPVWWAWLRESLKPFLSSHREHGRINAVHWAHDVLAKTAEQRYLGKAEQKRKVHTILAEFFSGKWAGSERKAFMDKKKQRAVADRYMPSQDLEMDGELNRRRLQELPYHLHHAQDAAGLQQDVLFNFEFLKATISCFGVGEAINNYRVYGGSDDGTQEVATCLTLASHVIEGDESQLAGQLLGRLQALVPKGEEYNTKQKLLELLLKQAREHAADAGTYSLAPQHACLQLGRTLAPVTEGSFSSFATDADSKTAAVASIGGNVEVWDLTSKKVVTENMGDREWCPVVDMSRDGALVLIGAASCKVWKASGTIVKTLSFTAKEHGRCVAVAFSPDATVCAALSSTRRLLVWDQESGTLSRIITVDQLVLTDEHHAMKLAVSNNHLHLTNDGQYYCWGEGTEVVLQRPASACGAMAVYDDGRALVATSHRVDLVDPSGTVTEDVLPDLPGRLLRHLSVSPGQETITACLDNGVIFFFDARSFPATELCDSRLCCEPVHAAVLGDNVSVAAITDLGKLMVSSSAAKNKLPPMHAAIVGSDGTTIVTGSEADDQKAVRLWDASTGKEANSIAVAKAGPRSLRRLPDSPYAVCAFESTVYVLDVKTAKLVSKCEQGEAPSPVTDVVITQDGAESPVVLSGHANGHAIKWSLAGDCLAVYEHDQPLTCLEITRPGRTVAAGYADGSFKLLNLESGQIGHSYSAHEGPVRVLRLTGHGLLSTGDDGPICLWNTSATGDEAKLRTYTSHTTAVEQIETLGDVFVSRSADKVLGWDVRQTDPTCVLSNPTSQTSHVCIARGNVALTSERNAVTVWNTASGVKLSTFTSDFAVDATLYSNEVNCAVITAGPFVTALPLPTLAKERAKQQGVSLFGAGGVPDVKTLQNMRQALSKPKPKPMPKPKPETAEQKKEEEPAQPNPLAETKDEEDGGKASRKQSARASVAQAASSEADQSAAAADNSGDDEAKKSCCVIL